MKSRDTLYQMIDLKWLLLFKNQYYVEGKCVRELCIGENDCRSTKLCHRKISLLIPHIGSLA